MRQWHWLQGLSSALLAVGAVLSFLFSGLKIAADGVWDCRGGNVEGMTTATVLLAIAIVVLLPTVTRSPKNTR